MCTIYIGAVYISHLMQPILTGILCILLLLSCGNSYYYYYKVCVGFSVGQGLWNVAHLCRVCRAPIRIFEMTREPSICKWLVYYNLYAIIYNFLWCVYKLLRRLNNLYLAITKLITDSLILAKTYGTEWTVIRL